MNMPLAAMSRHWGFRDFRQLVEDSAVLGLPSTQASLAQVFELCLQLAQLLNSLGHMADMLIQQLVDHQAIFRRRVLESQQDTNLVQRHVQASAMPDEGQTLDMSSAVNAVIACAAAWNSQQLLPLVKTDGLHWCVGEGGQFADSHGVFMGCSGLRLTL